MVKQDNAFTAGIMFGKIHTFWGLLGVPTQQQKCLQFPNCVFCYHSHRDSDSKFSYLRVAGPLGIAVSDSDMLCLPFWKLSKKHYC